LSPLFAKWDSPPVDKTKPFPRQLAKLSALIDSIDEDEILSRRLCLDGLDALEKAYDLHRSSYSGRKRTWMWPIELEKQRYDFSECRHPAAIVILAYCAAMVKNSEGPEWIWGGWSESVLRMAENELDSDWQRWLRGPSRCIRSHLDIDEIEA
jgi:hypothetical protein